MNELEKISHETMVFMRGKYCLDEIGDGKNELKFKQGQKTILTVYIHDDKFTFLVIFSNSCCPRHSQIRPPLLLTAATPLTLLIVGRTVSELVGHKIMPA